jgi:multiple sugar transport system substrate-binding protein
MVSFSYKTPPFKSKQNKGVYYNKKRRKVRMKKLGIVFAILLVLVLVLAACARNGNDTDPPAPDPGPAAADPPPPAPAPTPDPPAPVVDDDEGTEVIADDGIFRLHDPIDFGGRTLMVASDWGLALPYTFLNEDEPDPATSEHYFIDRLQWNNAQRIFEEYNFVLDYVHVVDGIIEVLTASVMAGDPVGDMVFLSGGQVLSSILGDLIMPLSAARFPGSDVLGAQIYARVHQEAFGEPWAFYYTTISPHVWFMGVNLDIINAIGAPNPVDLYTRGNWNWDTALEIMRLATADTDGDGLFDQWGLAGQPGDLVNHFIAANDGWFVDDDLNYAMDHPNTLEALEFMELIFHEGLWEYDPVLGADPGDWGRNFFAFQAGNSALFKGVFWGMNDGDLPFEFTIVPFPKGPSNYTGSTWMSGWGGGLTMPFGSSWEPSDMLRVSEEFFAWAGDEPELIAEGGMITPRNIFLTEDCVQRWVANSTRMRTDIGHVVPQYNWVGGEFVSAFINREMTVLQAVEAFRPPQQEMLDNFFGR